MSTSWKLHPDMLQFSTADDGSAAQTFHTNSTSVRVLLARNTRKEFIHFAHVTLELGCVGTAMSYTLLLAEIMMIKV